MLRDSKHKHRGEVSYSLADQLERSRGIGARERELLTASHTYFNTVLLHLLSLLQYFIYDLISQHNTFSVCAESPFQRFSRLKAEMEQLSSDLDAMNQEKVCT